MWDDCSAIGLPGTDAVEVDGIGLKVGGEGREEQVMVMVILKRSQRRMLFGINDCCSLERE